ncbi:MAG: hypothetical protein KGN97_04955 [Bacteroidota bacterium]|nr:hypothetical protein [Bacteroidota bacterium]
MMRSNIINIVSVLVGVCIGAIVNMAIILMGSSLIALPKGVDMTTDAGINAAMPLLEPKHFIMPFLAHAIGTFVAVYLATRFSKTKAIRIPIIIASIYLIGGIMEVMNLNAPLWFNIVDLVGAYFPMAFIAFKWAKRD